MSKHQCLIKNNQIPHTIPLSEYLQQSPTCQKSKRFVVRHTYNQRPYIIITEIKPILSAYLQPIKVIYKTHQPNMEIIQARKREKIRNIVFTVLIIAVVKTVQIIAECLNAFYEKISICHNTK